MPEPTPQTSDAARASASSQQGPSYQGPSYAALAVAALIAAAALTRRTPTGERERPREPGRARRPDPRGRPPQRRDEGGARDEGSEDDAEPKSLDPSQVDRDPARGREAERPREIPKLGWWDIGKRVLNQFSEDRLLMVAAGVTFYVILALFPAIAAFVSLYGLIFSPAQVAEQVGALEGVLPGGGVEILSEEVQRIAGQTGGTLGFGLAISVGIALWSANSGMKAIFDALNIVNGEREKRSFVWLNVVSMTFTIAALIIIGALVASVALAPAIFALLPLGQTVETVFNWLRWPIALVLIAGLLAVLYRQAPSREPPEWRWVIWGAVIGAIGWVAFSILYSWYVANFGTYNATYGALGAAIGFMIWIWLSVTIVLLGAELNAEMERQTAYDTTSGEPEPIGSRGAKAADEMGPAQS